MSIEVATWISDLQPLNPPSTDPRGQGDDHLRLIKLVLQDTFPTASKAFYNPTSATKSADFTVTSADMNKTFLVDTTSGIVNMTLPSLLSGDAGWECFLLKTNTGTSPVLVKPATGTLNSGEYGGLSAARRSIPGRRVQCLWTGTAWFIARIPSLPVSTIIVAQGSGLAVGYEYPNGQTLGSVATNYPELNSVLGSGVLLDLRGRVGVILDNLGGSAAGRLAGGVITGTAIGNTGGADTKVLVTANMAAHTHSGTTATENAAHSHTGGWTPSGLTAGSGLQSGTGLGSNTNTGSESATHAHTFTTDNGTGSATAVQILQPSIMTNGLMIVE